jgi:hypothetical protein
VALTSCGFAAQVGKFYSSSCFSVAKPLVLQGIASSILVARRTDRDPLVDQGLVSKGILKRPRNLLLL